MTAITRRRPESFSILLDEARGIATVGDGERLSNAVRDFFGTFGADLGTSSPFCSVSPLSRFCRSVQKGSMFRDLFGRSAEI
jgi:hypothetical protein